MDWEQFYQCVRHTISNISNSALVKMSAAMAAIFANAAFNMHVQLLFWFSVLIAIDLLTKWVAISHERLLENSQDACLWSSIVGIKAARESGKISSNEMKHRFLSKIFIYLIIVIIAAVTDAMLDLIKNEFSFVELVVWYLAASELISVVENLNAAGVELTNKLLQLIKNKTGLGGNEK